MFTQCYNYNLIEIVFQLGINYKKSHRKFREISYTIKKDEIFALQSIDFTTVIYVF